ncbi:MAG: hypothetical protein BAX61_13415 [Psychrobacter sp. B29-1]|uniref:hypothetical protein n=1 Tax=Psychrobacter sp. B29-1 TaxID=1867800 RepID=UPI00086CCA38|nr:hypothetical protein [Psychrobacter sp. B29-1]OEH66798.1 MAG: hypothetical protein BAX61_13415 [Psychrobacter sp. B29-1]
MKPILFTLICAAWGAFVTHQALADTVIIDDKEFQVVEIDGQKLVSNEWQPTTIEGYTDDYRASEQYKTVKAANETLRRIKGGEL